MHDLETQTVKQVQHVFLLHQAWCIAFKVFQNCSLPAQTDVCQILYCTCWGVFLVLVNLLHAHHVKCSSMHTSMCCDAIGVYRLGRFRSIQGPPINHAS